MSKELEALKRIRQETCPATYMADFDKNECCDVIKQALKRLEAIDNANPSEALEDLKELHELAYGDGWKIDEIRMSSHIKQALLKAEKNRKDLELIEKVRSGKTLIFVGKGLVMMNADKYHEYLKMEEEPISKKIKKCLKEQAWDIVVKKSVDMLLIKKYDNVSDYNSAVWLSGREKLIEEEFKLLKEMLE